MTINRKIWILVAAALVTCAAVSIIGLFGIRRVNTGVADIASRSLPAVVQTSDLRAAYLALIPLVYQSATNGDAQRAAAQSQEIDHQIENLIAKINEYAQHTTDEEELKVLDDAKRGMAVFISKINQVESLTKVGEQKMALDAIERNILSLHQSLTATFDKLVKLNLDHASTVADSANSASRSTASQSLVACVLGLIAICAVGFLLGRSIARPLDDLQRGITKTASDLDFTHTVKVSTDDEIGQALRAYNGLIQRLRASFSEIQQTSAQMANAAGEVSQRSREITDNSTTQSDASAQVAAAIEELTVSISVVASQAQEAAGTTRDSNDRADHGSEVILSAVEGIQNIAGSVREAAERINALRDDSDSISSVANMIKEIADQTNLLALNAAIEAARAGEQGRGFAVVADEVRKLAERTSHSTQEISALLSRMQGNAREAVSSMNHVIQDVDGGVDSARRAGDSIQNIKDSSESVVSAVSEISQAVGEQNAASTEIAQRIEQIAQMTERNRSAAEDAATAVQRVHEMSNTIARALAAYRV